jgi:DNA transposition AAA+ family ATPase
LGFIKVKPQHISQGSTTVKLRENKYMTNEQKQKITDALKQRISATGKSNEATATAIGISGGSVSLILNEKWKTDTDQLKSDKIWNQVAAWLGFNEGWEITTDIRNYKRIYNILMQAKKNGTATAIIGEPGAGKSAALKAIAGAHKDVYYVECAKLWTKKYFLSKLRQAMGAPDTGSSIPEMVNDLVSFLKKKRQPVIVLDESDKLEDSVLNVFLAIFNETVDICGFVLCGSPYMVHRVRKGCDKNRQSYKEIFSRVGGEFKMLKELSREDVAAVCSSNGIKDELSISEIFNDSKNDLRRVKHLVNEKKYAREKKKAA